MPTGSSQCTQMIDNFWACIDCALPFGLRSAPKIFNAVADALQWIIHKHGVDWIVHYLDDFLCAGPPGSALCSEGLSKMLECCQALGVPVASEKIEGPATTLTYLGIEMDTVNMQLRLPQDKLDRVKAVVDQWLVRRKAGKKRDLQSLAGLLQHAAKVFRPGRSFMSRLFETMESAKHPDHWVHLNAGFRSDLLWWHLFLDTWNGVSMLWDIHSSAPSVEVVSDASGTWGCGALCGSDWFQVQWCECFQMEPIHVKEMVPIVLAAALWGRSWSRSVVRFVSNTSAVVQVLKSGYARDSRLMDLMRMLFFIAARFEFWYVAAHLPGRLNGAADAISRNLLKDLFDIAPNLSRFPLSIPQEMLSLITNQAPDWTSKEWAERFSTLCSTRLPHQQESAQRRFLRFCSQGNLTPLPVSENNLCLYVAFLFQENLSSVTIKSYLSAVRHLQISYGLPDPFTASLPRLEQTLREVKVCYGRTGRNSSSQKLPITPKILREFKQLWKPHEKEYEYIMLWAACCSCFFGFFRSGEITSPSLTSYDPLTHLSFTDVATDSQSNPSLIQFSLKASKTNSFRKGVHVVVGRTSDDLCPVAAMLAYLAVRGGSPGPLFRRPDYLPLTRASFVSSVKVALATLGYDERKFAGHSFRAGAASTAAAMWIEDSLIKVMGRWESSAYQLYVRIPKTRLKGVSSVLAADGR